MTQVNLAKLIAENFQKDATLLAIKTHFHIMIIARCDAHHLPLSNHVVTSDDTKHQASCSRNLIKASRKLAALVFARGPKTVLAKRTCLIILSHFVHHNTYCLTNDMTYLRIWQIFTQAVRGGEGY